jgi:hypothetical protein
MTAIARNGSIGLGLRAAAIALAAIMFGCAPAPAAGTVAAPVSQPAAGG